MKKTNYETGQIPTPDDMNAQHLLTEEAFGDLVEAMTGGISSALLSNRPPSIVNSGPNWMIDVPEQYASVDGRVFMIEASQLSVPIKNNQVGLFFILKETDTVETRSRLRLTGSTVVRENFSPIVRKEEISRLSYTESTSSSDDPPAPSLSADDVGYVLYATIQSALGPPPTSSVTMNTAAVWNFPGGGLAVGLHAAQHMPGGNDQIPVAQIGGQQGSSVGLMPTSSLLFAMEAIQDVRVASSTPYLTASTNVSQSTLSTPRIVTLEMLLHNSLEVKSDGGQYKLGVRFASGPYAGNSGVAPHSNHKHPISESPITVDSARVEITTASQLGSIITLPPFGSFSEIYSVELLWGPPNITRPVPGVSCGWMKSSTGFIGVRAHLSASNQVTLEIGRDGLTQFQDSVKSWLGAQTWDSATADGNTPRTGNIHVKVIGVRT